MKKGIVLVVVAVILATASLLAACAEPEPEPVTPAPAQPTPAPAKPTPAPEPVKLRLTCGLPVGHHITEAFTLFKEEVEAGTNGLVTIETYPGGELFGHADVPRVLPEGGVEMAVSQGGHLAGLNEIANALTHPFSVTTQEEFAQGRDTLMTVMDTQFNKSNIKILAPFDYGQGAFSCRVHMIKQPADCEGLKIRGPSEAYLNAIEAYGGIPASLAAAEVYDALGKGSIDGALVGWSTFGSRAYYEVADYFSGHTTNSPWYLIMNLDSWNALGADTQGVFTAAAKKAEETCRTLGREGDEKWRQIILDAGCEIHIFTPEEVVVWKEASRPVFDKWIAKCKDAGVDAEAIQIMRDMGVPGY